jgi:uncharacterized membrane protein
MAGIAYYLLQYTIIREQGSNSLLKEAIGSDFKGKISPVFYAVGIAVAGSYPWLSAILYVAIALIWLVPDRRIEKKITQSGKSE